MLSLDGLFVEGASTTTVSENNRQRSFALGQNLVLSDAVSATLSYTGTVSRNADGTSGHVIRPVAEFSL